MKKFRMCLNIMRSRPVMYRMTVNFAEGSVEGAVSSRENPHAIIIENVLVGHGKE